MAEQFDEKMMVENVGAALISFERDFSKTPLAVVRGEYFRDCARAVLTALSQTHAIVPQAEYERLKTVLESAAIVREQGVIRKTCVSVSFCAFARMEYAIADWEVHAGIGFSANDLKETPHV